MCIVRHLFCYGQNMKQLTAEQRSNIMRSIKSTNTKDEVRLTKELWSRGHRYRRNSKFVFGKPDVSFKKYKIAIFIDGEFFHGRNWESLKSRLLTNRDFWIKKIERNMQRDLEVTQFLQSKGWTVLRFWNTEIKNNLHLCIEKIEFHISEVRNKDF